MSDTYMTVKQLIHYLYFSQSKIYQLIHRRKIPFIKIDHSIRFIKTEIDLWMKSQPGNAEGGIVSKDILRKTGDDLKANTDAIITRVKRFTGLLKSVRDGIIECLAARVIYVETRGPDHPSVKAINMVIQAAWRSLNTGTEEALKESIHELGVVQEEVGKP